MIIARANPFKVIHRGTVPDSFVDSKPVRFIDDEGTLRGIRPFAWGKTLPEVKRLAREKPLHSPF